MHKCYGFYNKKMVIAFNELLKVRKLNVKQASEILDDISYQTARKIGKDDKLSLKLILNIYKQCVDLIREDNPDFQVEEKLDYLNDVEALNKQLISDIEIFRKKIESEFKQEITNTDMHKLLKPSAANYFYSFLLGDYQYQIDKIFETYAEIERLTNDHIRFDFEKSEFVNEYH